MCIWGLCQRSHYLLSHTRKCDDGGVRVTVMVVIMVIATLVVVVVVVVVVALRMSKSKDAQPRLG